MSTRQPNVVPVPILCLCSWHRQMPWSLLEPFHSADRYLQHITSSALMAGLLADVSKSRQQMQHIHGMPKVGLATFIFGNIPGTRQ